MRKALLLAATSALVIAPVVSAQSSQFGSRGLGHLGRGLSVAALGTQGAIGLFDPGSSRNPAALGRLSSPITVVNSLQGWRTSNTPLGSGKTSEQRFPHLLVGGPVPGSSIGITVSFSNYTNRDFLLVSEGVSSPRGVPVQTVDSVGSTGGINDLRLAVGWSPVPNIQVGLGAHLLTGSSDLFSSRVWSDSSYLPLRQSTELTYLGAGFSAGVVFNPTSDLYLAGTIRRDGSLSVERDSASVGQSIALPISLSAAMRYRVSRNIAVAAMATTQNWSSSNDDIIAHGGIGAENTMEVAAGVELVRDIRRPEHLPLKLGFRRTDLPFLISPSEQATETAFSIGTGFRFARDLGGIDIALERANRTLNDAFSETAWQLSIGVTLRGSAQTQQ